MFRNYCPLKAIICNDKDPLWLMDRIKTLIGEKSALYKSFPKNNKFKFMFNCLAFLNHKIEEMIIWSKEKYYSILGLRLNNPRAHCKIYWSLLKTLVNGRRVPLIPPIQIGDKFVTNFTEQDRAFNDCFAKKNRVNDRNSQPPDRANFCTNERLGNMKFSNVAILKILKNLYVNKAHGHDNLSVRITRLCHDSIFKPLELVFRDCLKEDRFPSWWKKANIVPIHKKNKKNLIINYRAVSLLPICNKAFERLIYNSIYKFLSNNNLLSQNQSRFRSGNSCINQLISITQHIFYSFDSYEWLEGRGVFLIMSKAVAWSVAWRFNLQTKNPSYFWRSFTAGKKFSSNRKQRVVLNGQYSDWQAINASAP